MRLREEFLSHISGEEAFLVPAGKLEFRGLIKGNETLGEVIKFLKTDTTEEKIVMALREKYDAPAGVIEFDVKKAVEILRSVGAIIDN